jgi:dodecin
MAGSVYKIVELVGSSDSSWEEAARNAVETAGRSLKDLRIAEVTKFDMTIENGKITSYRTRINLSSKYVKED